MSDIGEEIINRLPSTSSLKNTDNSMYKIIVNGVGEWLDEKDDEEFLEQFFIQEANGAYLDLHGNDFNIKRNLNESDDDYRTRIVYESLGHLTVDFLKEVYDVGLYTYTDDFSVSDNVLTSDNPYISTEGFIGVADSDTQAILNKKFVLGGGVTWL